MSGKRNQGKRKEVGDVTSFTIPNNYIDVVTGEEKPITVEMLNLINSALQQRELVHWIMTGIATIKGQQEYGTSITVLDQMINNRLTEMAQEMANKLNDDLRYYLHKEKAIGGYYH